MQKFGEFVCKHKRIILIIMLILLIPSIIGMKATKINYDIKNKAHTYEKSNTTSPNHSYPNHNIIK